ncbi:MAG: hypothetical protein EXX96DRAFT_68429 [Benjaminiella poitrasii]|nr:MAG: hypothetical protein EXX96DRAFT_68429 [Benjaminiella poitrasii]
MMNEGLLSVKNASGRQVSLLNSNDDLEQYSPSPNEQSLQQQQDNSQQQSKRKYHCTEPGCNKSFTTSGHLARHNRIHTGEKNFPCLFPGCQSRFSRQDNMMQHYRTHMSPKSRRSQKRGMIEETRPRPRLHAHHRIRSDPVRVEPPLTIDQHLSNYHQSLRISSSNNNNSSGGPTNILNERYTPVRFNFPLPLSAAAKSPSTLKKVVTRQQQESEKSPSPTSSITSLPSIHHIMDDTKINNNNTNNSISSSSSIISNDNNINSNSSSNNNMDDNNSLGSSPLPTFTQHYSEPMEDIISSTTTTPTEKPVINSTLFYQHRPLTFTRPRNPSFPYTLLHPAKHEGELSDVTRSHNNNNENYKRPTKSDDNDEDNNNNNNNNNKKSNSSSSSGLLQLAHIVSTFG